MIICKDGCYAYSGAKVERLVRGLTMKQHDDSMKLEKRGYGRVELRKEGWTDGEVLTPFGIVTVYAQGDKQNVPHTRLDFVWGGRLYMRNFSGKRYSPRGLVTKAREFASEIAAPPSLPAATRRATNKIKRLRSSPP